MRTAKIGPDLRLAFREKWRKTRACTQVSVENSNFHLQKNSIQKEHWWKVGILSLKNLPWCLVKWRPDGTKVNLILAVFSSGFGKTISWRSCLSWNRRKSGVWRCRQEKFSEKIKSKEERDSWTIYSGSKRANVAQKSKKLKYFNMLIGTVK